MLSRLPYSGKIIDFHVLFKYERSKEFTTGNTVLHEVSSHKKKNVSHPMSGHGIANDERILHRSLLSLGIHLDYFGFPKKSDISHATLAVCGDQMPFNPSIRRNRLATCQN